MNNVVEVLIVRKNELIIFMQWLSNFFQIFDLNMLGVRKIEFVGGRCVFFFCKILSCVFMREEKKGFVK